MATLETIRRLTLRAKAEGFEDAAAKLGALGRAQEKVRVESDRTAQSSGQLDKAFTRAVHAADPLQKSLSQYEKTLRLVNTAQAKGVGTTNEYATVLAASEKRVIAAARGNEVYAASYGKLNVAVSALAPVLSRLGLGGAAGLIGGGAIAGGITAVVGAATGIATAGDQWTKYENRLRAAGEASETLGARMEQLTDLALRSRGSLGSVVDLYAGLRKATQDLLRPQDQVAQVTETITKAFTLSGQSAASASAAMMQLNQAFASGTLRGDELNSVLEQAPALARLIAKEFGVGVGQIRALAEQGKITAERVFDAILKGGKDIDALFKNTNPTIESGFTALTDSVTKLGAELDKTMGLSKGFAAFLNTSAREAKFLADEIKRAREEAQKMPEIRLRPGAMMPGPPPSAAQNAPGARFGGPIPAAAAPPGAMGSDASTRRSTAGLIAAEAEAMTRATTASEGLAKAQLDLAAANARLVQEGMLPLEAAMLKAFAANETRLAQYKELRDAGVDAAEVAKLEAESQRILGVELARANPELERQATITRDTTTAMQFERAAIEAEIAALRMSATARNTYMAGVKAELDLKARNVDVTSDLAKEYIKEAKAVATAAKALEDKKRAQGALEGQQDQLREIQLETSLIGRNEETRQRAIRAMQTETEVRRLSEQGLIAEAEEYQENARKIEQAIFIRESAMRRAASETARRAGDAAAAARLQAAIPRGGGGGDGGGDDDFFNTRLGRPSHQPDEVHHGPPGTVANIHYRGYSVLITWVESAEHIAERLKAAAEAAEQVRESVHSAAQERMSRDVGLYGGVIQRQIEELRQRREQLGSVSAGMDRGTPYLDPYSIKNPTRFYNPGPGGHFGGPEGVIEGAISSASSAEIAAIDAQIAQLEAQAAQLDRLAMLSSAGVELSAQELAELQAINAAIRGSAAAQELSDIDRMIAASNARLDAALRATLIAAQESIPRIPGTATPFTRTAEGGSAGEISSVLAASYGSGFMPTQRGTAGWQTAGFANGGEFMVGGPRGIDIPRVIGLAGGEHVTVTPANANMPRARPVVQHNAFYMQGAPDEARRSAGEYLREARRQANRIAR